MEQLKKKNFIKSTTIQSAIASFLVLSWTIGSEIYENKKLEESQALALAGSAVALWKTIEGRANAKTGITTGKDEYDKITPSPPQVEGLPSATPIVDIDDVEVPVSFSTTPSNVIEPLDEIPPNIVEENKEDSAESNASEGEIDIYSLQTTEGKYYIVPKENTRIKEVNKDSSELTASQFGELEKNKMYPINSYKKEGVNSMAVTFDSEPSKTYYLFIPHINLYRPDKTLVDLSEATPEVINTKKTPIKLPGYQSTFYLEDSITPGGHFSWAEATKNWQRKPQSKQVVNNIIKVAKDLEDLREHLGNKPIRVTSWYRDPATNRRVGGASRSSHLQGYAVDFFVPGMSIWTVQKQVQNYWRHGGIGLGANRGFVHCASDGWYRVWNY